MRAMIAEGFDDCMVVHFGVEGTNINAYTLASTLTGLADAAKAANNQLNPGYDVEIVVESLGSGSFKAIIRGIFRGAENLFSKQQLKAIVFGVIANFVYQNTLAPSDKVDVEVRDDKVSITQGEFGMEVPREVHDATLEVQDNLGFRNGVSRAIASIERDEKVQLIGFIPRELSEDPETVRGGVSIPRDRFSNFPEYLDGKEKDKRNLQETTELEILRAILERSKKKWRFVWGGIEISAPVLHDQFYDDFYAHDIRIAPGDRLRVKLRIRQKRQPDSGIWVNDPRGYAVLEVLDHLPHPKQQNLLNRPMG